ncbi:hypothetical protein Dimus_027170 [Dionaea muscipula]
MDQDLPQDPQDPMEDVNVDVVRIGKAAAAHAEETFAITTATPSADEAAQVVVDEVAASTEAIVAEVVKDIAATEVVEEEIVKTTEVVAATVVEEEGAHEEEPILIDDPINIDEELRRFC